MWTKQTVDEAVKSYAMDKARAAHLEVEIAELERRFNTAVNALAGDEAGPKAQRISDMPHGTSVGNPTEELAIKLASGWLPPEVRDMQSEAKELKAEYAKAAARVRFVDAWMGALSERERWIIVHQCMRQEFWRDVVEDYTKEFGGQFITKDTLKFLRGRAFKRIYAAAGIKN